MMRATTRPTAIHLLIHAGMLCVALACAGEAAAQARTYALDPVHTRVMFAVDHAGFSKAIGTVSGSTGTLRFDPDDWTSARLEAWVPLQHLDLGDEKWNQATLARNLLDAQRHPYAVFVSERIEPLEENRARVHGMLTLRGVSMPVVLEATLNALKRHPMPPFRRTVGFSATALLQRTDFGISAWPTMIGNEIEMRIEVEAVHAPGAGFSEDEHPLEDGPPAPPDQAAADADEADDLAPEDEDGGHSPAPPQDPVLPPEPEPGP